VTGAGLPTRPLNSTAFLICMARKPRTQVTKEVSDSVVKMYNNQEFGISKIQQLHNIGRGTLYRILERAGVPISRNKRRVKGDKRKHRTEVTPELMSRMIEMRNAGMELKVIAAVCDVSYSTAMRYTTAPVQIPNRPEVQRMHDKLKQINEQRIENPPLPITMIEPPSLWARFKRWIGF
jgi:DNA invertase Pin-like site-specific DNA recombinase